EASLKNDVHTAPSSGSAAPAPVASASANVTLVGNAHTIRQESEPAPELRWFDFEHLPEPLRSTSKLFHDTAHALCQSVPASAERTVALRKLLEGKDAAVRATLEANR